MLLEYSSNATFSRSIGRTAVSIAMLALAIAVGGGTWPLHGQETERLMDQTPFDVLTLDKANDSKVMKVYPVRLPGRRVPENPKRTDKIRVKLLEDEQEYDVAWANIVKLELYEQLVVTEVNKLT